MTQFWASTHLSVTHFTTVS